MNFSEHNNKMDINHKICQWNDLDYKTGCEMTESQWDLYYKISWWIQGIVSLVLSSIGILLNSVAAIVLVYSNKKKTASFNRLLACLALFDNLYLLSGISEAFRGYIIKQSYYYDYIFVMLIYPIRGMVMFCSIYTTVVLAMVRHNAVTRPLDYMIRVRTETFDSPSNVIKYIIPLTIGSIIFYLPKFFEFKITDSNEPCASYNNSATNENSTTNEYFISETILRRDKNYVLWYMNIVNFIITAALPFILLVYFNFGIYKEMKRFKTRQPKLHINTKQNRAPSIDITNKPNSGSDQSIIVLCLVILFVCTHILRGILNIREIASFEWILQEHERGCNGVTFWAMLLVPISEFMLLLNSSANFFIYYLFHKDFTSLIKVQRNKSNAFSQLKSRSLSRNRNALKEDAQTPCLQEIYTDINTQQGDPEKTPKTENLELVEIHAQT